MPAPTRFFVVASLTFGVAMAFFTPPFEAPDEPAHLYRAYQISRGHIVPEKIGDETGGQIPAGLADFAGPGMPSRREYISYPYEHYRDLAARFRVGSETRFVPFSNAAVNPPLPYLPHALGILVSQLCTNSALLALWCGRIAGLFSYILLAAIAIHIMPVCKWALTLIALTPMPLFIAASISSDTVTNGIAFLFLAQVFRLALAPGETLTRRRLLELLATAATLALCKQAYFPLLASALIVPVERVGRPCRYWLAAGLLALVTLAAAGAWGLIAHGTYSPARPEANPWAQLQDLVSHPDTGLSVLSHAVDQGPMLLGHFVGNLGWLDLPLPQWLAPIHLIVLVLVAVGDRSPDVPPLPEHGRLIALTVAAVSAAAVFFALYLTWDKAGAGQATGIQGRYFVPIAPLAFLPLCGLYGASDRQYPRYLPLFAKCYAVVPLLLALQSIGDRYY